jgi:RNA polymerase sigma factor (sigma-70 family)
MGELTLELRDLCRKALATAVSKYGWQGRWDEAVFVEEIGQEAIKRLGSVKNQPLTKIAESAGIFCYSHRWHQACQADGTVEQGEAFQALSNYLYRVALPQVNGNETLAQEIAQEALVAIWRTLQTVREPGAFIQFARLTTMRQAWHIRDSETKLERDELDEEMIEEPEATNPLPEQEDESEETQSQLEEIIRRCLPSADRKKVIIDSLLHNRSIKEIADDMGKKPNAVSVLKTRAIDQLRKCKELEAYRKRMKAAQTPEGDQLSKAVQHFLNVIEGASDGMSCEECRDLLPEYVEAEVSGFAVTERYPEVKRHLDLCRSCEREYVALLESMIEEMEVGLPNVQTPPADLSFLPPISFRVYVKLLIEDVMRRQLPHRLGDLEARLDLFLRRMEAWGDRSIPQAVAVMGPERTFEQLHLATYDVARTVVQSLDVHGQAEPIDSTELTRLVESAAREAAQRQGLTPEQTAEFTATMVEQICRTPALLQRIER